MDSALYNGCTLSPYYDSLAAQGDGPRPHPAGSHPQDAPLSGGIYLRGFPTNAELSYELLFHPTFVRGGCTTAFLDRSLPELLEFSRRVDRSQRIIHGKHFCETPARLLAMKAGGELRPR